jgi:hypothetical protein
MCRALIDGSSREYPGHASGCIHTLYPQMQLHCKMRKQKPDGCRFLERLLLCDARAVNLYEEARGWLCLAYSMYQGETIPVGTVCIMNAIMRGDVTRIAIVSL